MIGIQLAKQRFSLYNLNEGEMFIKDFVASVKLYVPMIERQETLKGRIYISSRSLIFEPDDTSYPLMKFNYRDMKSLPFIIPSKYKENPSTLNFEIERIIEISDHFNENYKSHKLITNKNKNSTISLVFEFENIFVVSKIINELIEKFNSKESRFEFDTVDYLGNFYSFKFDLTLIKSANEKFQTYNELYIKQLLPLIEVPGLFRLTDVRIYFQPLFKLKAKKCISTKISKIQQLYKRRVHLKNTGIEIITEKKSLLFEYDTESNRNIIYDKILELASKDVITNVSIEKYTKAWMDGAMSNYDYLIKLNSAANRTRNDLAQYPIFPWTIINFKTDKIDLNDKSNYRDLTKPIGALNQKRLDEFLKRYREMPEPKFMYGTFYSNSAYVIGYLNRKYPEYMLKLHGGKFDSPDRLFNSIEIDWNINYSNPGCLKELIPEFFEKNSDFLLNNKNLELGITSRGEKIGRVNLPLWAESADHFLEVMRQSLESDYVNENIHHWIDLVFGYKQKGIEAVKANNLFHPSVYEDGSNFSEKSEEEILMIKTQATEFGTCPTQLFNIPHPKKFSKGINEIYVKLEEDKLNSNNVEKEADAEGSGKDDRFMDFVNLDFKLLPKHHKSKITASGYLSDTKLLITGAYDGYLKLYDFNSSGVKRMMQLSNLEITSIAEQNDHNLIFVGSADNNVYVFNTTMCRATSTINAHEDTIVGLFYSEKNNLLITDSGDTTYKTWRVSNTNRIPLHIYYDTDGSIITCDYREDDNTHICIDEDGLMVYRKLGKENEMKKVYLEPNPNYKCMFDKKNLNQYFIGDENKFDIYDIRMHKVVKSIDSWAGMKGMTNDYEKILFMSKKSLFVSKFIEPDNIVQEWSDKGKLSHLKLRCNKNKDDNIVILGNENGDIYYANLK